MKLVAHRCLACGNSSRPPLFSRGTPGTGGHDGRSCYSCGEKVVPHPGYVVPLSGVPVLAVYLLMPSEPGVLPFAGLLVLLALVIAFATWCLPQVPQRMLEQRRAEHPWQYYAPIAAWVVGLLMLFAVGLYLRG